MDVPKSIRYLTVLGILCTFAAVICREPISTLVAHYLYNLNPETQGPAYDTGVKRGSEVSALISSSSPLSERPLGLHVLHEPLIDGNTVNLIFVHGLGGSAKDTWTHSSHAFWPTLLNEDDRFANARILTFGYAANFKNVLAPKNTLGIADFAKQLVHALDLFFDKYGSDVRSSKSV